MNHSTSYGLSALVFVLATACLAQDMPSALETPQRHRLLEIMGRTYWHGYEWNVAQNPTFGNPEVDRHPAFADAISCYLAEAQPPPPEVDSAVWPHLADNFRPDEPDRWILEKCPDPTRPFFITYRSERNKATWGSPVRVDLDEYRAWRAKRPNLLVDGWLGEWCNDINNARSTALQGKVGIYRDERPDSSNRVAALRKFLGEKPKDRYEQLALLKRYWAMRKERNYGGTLAVMDAHLNTLHIAADFGSTYLRIETTASGAYNYQIAPMFTRGASRQFGVLWEWYVANYMNGPSKQHPGEYLGDAVCRYPQTADATGEPAWGKKHGTWRITNYGPDFGLSRSVFKRTHYLAYLSGANVTFLESWRGVLLEWDKAAGRLRFSPRGRIFADYIDFTRAHPDRGAHYSPVAVCVPLAQGYPVCGGSPFADSAFGYTAGDKAVDAIFHTLVPRGCYGERSACGGEHLIVNSPFADMYDVIVPDAESQSPETRLDVMKSYRALVVAGDYRDKSWEKTLARYEAEGGKVIRVDKALLADEITSGQKRGILCGEARYPALEAAFAKLQEDYFPFEVSGSCAYGLTVAKNHVWLYVFNNDGVVKFADALDELDPAKAADITVKAKGNMRTTDVTELLSGKKIIPANGSFGWHLGPGEFAIFEIR